MIDNNKIAEIVQVLERVVKNDWIHLVFAGNMLAIMKEYMVEEEIDEFPIMILEGRPGCGKTTIAKSVVFPRCEKSQICEKSNKKSNVFITTDIVVHALKKEFRKRESDYIVLDDFAIFTDSDIRRKTDKILNEIVRPSFAGTAPLFVLTVETGALKKITDSLHSRVITLSMNAWKQFPDNEKLLDDLRNIRWEISELLKEFAEWTMGKEFNIRLRKRYFVNIYKGKEDERSIGIFFAYEFAMNIFWEFLVERYKISFSMEEFRNSYRKVWKKRSEKCYSDLELVKYLFKKLIEENAFECQIPREKQLCCDYCMGICSVENIKLCSGNSEYCNGVFIESKNGSFYDPYELVLEDGENSALVITNAGRICGFPKYKRVQIPLLIIERNNLLNLLNNALEKYCIEMDMEHEAFVMKDITSAFKEYKMCLSRKPSDHSCFSFRYPTEALSYEKKEVYILRLSNEDYKKICESSTENRSKIWMKSQRKNCEWKECKKIARELQDIFQSIRWRYGKSEL